MTDPNDVDLVITHAVYNADPNKMKVSVNICISIFSNESSLQLENEINKSSAKYYSKI